MDERSKVAKWITEAQEKHPPVLCPFCGLEPTHPRRNWSGVGKRSWKIFHNSAVCPVEITVIATSSTDRKAIFACYAKWNTRKEG